MSEPRLPWLRGNAYFEECDPFSSLITSFWLFLISKVKFVKLVHNSRLKYDISNLPCVSAISFSNNIWSLEMRMFWEFWSSGIPPVFFRAYLTSLPCNGQTEHARPQTWCQAITLSFIFYFQHLEYFWLFSFSTNPRQKLKFFENSFTNVKSTSSVSWYISKFQKEVLENINGHLTA